MPLFLSALLGALPAVVSGVSSLFGGGGGGGFLGGLFGGGGPSAGPRITTVSGTSRTGFTRAQLGGSFPVQPIFGGFDPFGGARPSFPVSRSSFGLRGRGRVARAPQAPQVRPTHPPPVIPLGHRDFAADTMRAQVGAFHQVSTGRLRFTGGPTVAACPRGSPHPLPTIPLSMTPDSLARIRIGASCV